MTPAEFEWRQEQLEIAYERGQIGKLAFTKRMTALGLSIKSCQDFMPDADKRRAEKIGAKVRG